MQDVWEDAFKHAIEDHMNCKGAQGWERRWLVVYKSEIVRRHDTAGIWVAFFQERQQLLASGFCSSKSASNCRHLGCILPRVPAISLRTGAWRRATTGAA